MFRITSFSDIAGQLTAASDGADKVTVGAVLLPSGGLKQIRRMLPNGLPKWRDTSDEILSVVLALLLRESLSISAASVDKTSSQWLQFWKDAADVHGAVASLEKTGIGFLKSATLLKIILFGHASAVCLGHAVFIKSMPDSLRRQGMLEISEHVVIDNEIQGKANREALLEVWRAINAHQSISNSIGLRRTATSLSLETEQSETLLLFADYVAGIVHAANSHADTLRQSRVSPEAAKMAFAALQRAKIFTEYGSAVKLDYFAIFPDFKRFSRRGPA